MRSLEGESDAVKERAKFALEWGRRWNRGEARQRRAALPRVRDWPRDGLCVAAPLSRRRPRRARSRRAIATATHLAHGFRRERRGLSYPRKQVRRTAPPTLCVDFKGQFRTGDGRSCYPLTILDAYSRFLVRCEVASETTTTRVCSVFDSAFESSAHRDPLRQRSPIRVDGGWRTERTTSPATSSTKSGRTRAATEEACRTLRDLRESS